MSERMGVSHDCDQPYRNGIVRRKPWTCPVCRRTWEPTGPDGWFTDDQGGEVIGFVVRYPDGSTQAFGHLDSTGTNPSLVLANREDIGRRPSDG